MTGWPKVTWTQARQLVALLDETNTALPAPEVAPDAYLAGLRASGERGEALAFLGVALPRHDAVRWAARELGESDPHPTPARALVRQAIARWIDAVDDSSRRAAFDAGATVPGSAEQILAQAAFFSGGSIAPPDLPAVHPAPDLAGRLAAAAILKGAHAGHGAAAAHLDRAIGRGDAIARGAEA